MSREQLLDKYSLKWSQSKIPWGYNKLLSEHWVFQKKVIDKNFHDV